jgi:hypothetical protein
MIEWLNFIAVGLAGFALGLNIGVLIYGRRR